MYFLPVFGLFFKILIVSFEMLRFLILLMSNLTIFFPLWIVLLMSYLICLTQDQKDLCLLLEAFIVLGFTLRLMIYVEFVFVYGVRSKLLILHMITQLFQQHLLKRLFFIELSRHLYWNVLNHKCVGLFLDFFCSID